MGKIYLAEKAQLDAQNATLEEINSKIEAVTLSSVNVSPVDFLHDQIEITSGGLDELNRIITT